MSCSPSLRMLRGNYVGGEFLGRVDRKSTRLNSRHLVTSYAVFCLKKETNRLTLAGHSIVSGQLNARSMCHLRTTHSFATLASVVSVHMMGDLDDPVHVHSKLIDVL